MRKLSFLSSLLLIFLTAFTSPTETYKKALIPQTSSGDPFILGAMENYTDANYSYISDPDEFGMNLWSRYNTTYTNNGREEPFGWNQYDFLHADVSSYASLIESRLSDNHSEGMRTMMTRPKIEWLCYGQRSDYQCEEIPDNDRHWFYSFQSPNHTGNDVTDVTYGGGASVRYCDAGSDSQGLVVSKLKANNEQAHDGLGPQFDGGCTWFIKPRIRIDSAIAYDPQNPKVCKVKVIAADSTVLKEVDIHANDFLVDAGDNYDGRYIEEFNFDPGTNLAIQGSWGSMDAFSTRGNTSPDEWWMSKADIQVHWYGNCDMWIDYVRVDNDIADGLLNPNSANFNTYNDWIEDEVNLAGYNSSPYKFYIELFEFNNIPCMKYVNEKIKSIDPRVDLMADFFWVYYARHLPWEVIVDNGWWTPTGDPLDAESVAENLIDEAGITTFFIETYPLTGSNTYPPPNGFSKIPNTLNLPSLPSPGILATAVSPSEYDTWLQEHFDASGYPNPSTDAWEEREMWEDPGYYRWNLELANGISKIRNINWINMPQAHLWYEPNAEVRREPTNEELDLMTNMALSYGAKGLIYFFMGGV